MPLAQYYAVGVDMEYPYNIYGGLQDNGSWRGPSTKRGGGPIYFEDWERVGGGDGMYNVVDWSNNRYLYNESQFGPLQRLDLLTGERKSIRYSRPEGEEPLRWNWKAGAAPSSGWPWTGNSLRFCPSKTRSAKMRPRPSRNSTGRG